MAASGILWERTWHAKVKSHIVDANQQTWNKTRFIIRYPFTEKREIWRQKLIQKQSEKQLVTWSVDNINNEILGVANRESLTLAKR